MGLAWEKQTVPVDVGGVLKNTPGVLIRGEISHLPPVTFAWVHRTSDEIRTILGQMNFFQHYRITFEAYNEIFEITAKKSCDNYDFLPAG